jgi:hypothetical protein
MVGVFEKRLRWETIGAPGEKVRRKLRNEELHDSYVIPGDIMSAKPRTMRDGLGM